MAVTTLITSWLGYDRDTGELLFWDGTLFRSLQEAAGYLAKAGGTISGDLTIGGTLAVTGTVNFADVVTFTGQNKLNKATSGATASWLWQTGFSGRAEIGTITDDNLSFKVSPDGAAWHLGLSIDKSTGHVGLNGYTADSTNGLGLKATNVLLDNEGSHLRALFNKHAAGDDASFGFETNYSARALLGLLGDDNFTLKTSPDGSTFKTAFVADKTTGQIDLTQNAKFSAYANFDDYHAAGAFAKIGFNTANHNDQAAFVAANNNFVAPVPGCYLIEASYIFKKNVTLPTQIMLALFVNAAEAAQTRVLTSTIVDQGTTLATSGVLKLAAGDVVDARCQFITNDGYVMSTYNSFAGARVS